MSSTELLTKDQAMDGVVNVPPSTDFKVDSNNVDVLRLQICKSQVTQELSNECISVIQGNIDKDISHSNYIGYSIVFILACAFIFVVYMIMRGPKI